LAQLRTLGAKIAGSLFLVAALAAPLWGQDLITNQGPLLGDQADARQGYGARKFLKSRPGFLLLENMVLDQKAIWTSPFHLRSEDGAWLFPLATLTALSVATDRSFVHSLSNDANRVNRYRHFSNGGTATLLGWGASSYLWSYISHGEHERETGILTAEAVMDSLLATQALKLSFGRERPTADRGRLDFFKGGNSFPSDHAAAAWSAAAILTHEYSGGIPKTLAYGLATAVSASALMSKAHSPSDVLVGSTVGWLIGRYTYGARHNPDLAGATLGDLPGKEKLEGERGRQDMGSPFVPLDSWVYAAFERLAALRYVRSAILGLKPWTRMECARLAEEAAEALETADAPGEEAAGLVGRVQQEFAYELDLLGGGHNLAAHVDSLYVRALSISGPALADSYHFGQTVAYDFGRPFERGASGQAGGSFDAVAGPLVIYVRAEYQHAPPAPAFSDGVRDVIARADGVPLSEAPLGALPATNDLQLLDSYAGVDIHNWQLLVGRQSLCWAPGPGSMMWSDNIAPLMMVRLVNPEPFFLPGILRRLGPVRVDQFFGRLDGHPYVPNPFVFGQKINLRVFSFLELGFGRRSMIGGTGGNPLNAGNFVRSFFGVVNPRLHSVPGDNESEMDWTFYVPKLRNYIVLYGDAYAEDDVLPIENPPRNPWHPGIYLPRIPGIPRLDLCLEGVSTESSSALIGGGNAGRYNYYNAQYPDGNTENGRLIGNVVGREGRAIQARFRYWLSPRNTVQFVYRHNSVSADFIPGGGAWQDYAVRNEFYLRNGFYLKSELQYEKISHYPVLFQGPQRNVTALLEMGFYPRKNLLAQENRL
jgi:capsule assembly protein Wzi/PAP2 superfamily protein